MDAETERLMERWITTFCETPPVLDAELMRRVLAEMGHTEQEPQG